ncbi:MAG TPA: AMP-binding protein, partial [Patescibacteria group bacterium]|nr:AMP-binding protein [Patescibacteria group bacterium]
MTTAPARASGHVFPWLKSYAPGVDWNVEIPQQPVYAFLGKTIARFPDRTALQFAGHHYDYKTVGALVDCAAKGLWQLGVKKGTKVGLFMPNTAYSVVMYYAVLKAGATVVNFNPAYIERDLAAQANDSDTQFLVTLDLPPLMDKAKAVADASKIEKIILCPMKQNLRETTVGETAIETARAVWFRDLIHNDGQMNETIIDPERDIAVLQYTGGTTGIPKGAALTHKNLVANATQIGQWYHNAKDGEDSMVAVLPLFHVFAMTVVMNMSIMKGMTLIIMSAFSISELLEIVKRDKPAYLAAVPAMYIALANYDRISEHDFSTLKFCLSGGAPLPAEVKRLFETRTKAKLVAEGYGLTEFSPVATCNPLTEKARAGSIGLPIPGTLVEILSLVDGETVLQPGEKGEICVHGPQMMAGYYKRDDETAQVIKNGRLHTGDVGYMDDDGFVYVVDRVKDMVLVAGYNVYPRHIEEVLFTHPAVE